MTVRFCGPQGDLDPRAFHNMQKATGDLERLTMRSQTCALPHEASHTAPDGSEIRLLPDMRGGGLSHCILLAGRTSAAVAHRSVEEIWYFLQGRGEIWRRLEKDETVEAVHAGICVTIPPRTQFQFRNTGEVPLIFIITTMPPWPGPQEAKRVPDHWALDGEAVVSKSLEGLK
jgi:mannose-6-phosphate isomerase-like protein (cupin superfamily)